MSVQIFCIVYAYMYDGRYEKQKRNDVHLPKVKRQAEATSQAHYTMIMYYLYFVITVRFSPLLLYSVS